MKKVEYDEFWVPKDVRHTGLLFEYCDVAMKDLYSIDIDIEKFLIAFMNSNVRKKMEAGNPRLLSQSYIDTIECFIKVDCNGDYEQFELTPDSFNRTFPPFKRMWIGRIYIKMAYRYELSLAEITRRMPFGEMIEHYRLGHEISEEAYLNSVRYMIERINHEGEQ